MKKMRAAQTWVEKAELTLTEAALITNRCKKNMTEVEVGRHAAVSMPTVTYLRVILDAKLGFREHLEYAYQKAPGGALAGILLNVGRSKHCRRLLLAGVMRSILLYASPVVLVIITTC